MKTLPVILAAAAGTTTPGPARPSDTELPRTLEFVAAAVGELEMIEAAEEGGSSVPRFEMSAYNGGLMHLFNFYYPVIVDLAGMELHSEKTPILRQHDQGRVVGHSTNVDIKTRTIKVRGLISGAGDDAREVVEASKNGFPWQASIGASASRIEYVEEGETVKVNGQNFTGPVYVARKSTLVEVSFVAAGANQGTTTKVAASKESNTMNFEQWLTARGFTLADLSDGQRQSLQAIYDAEVTAQQRPGNVPEPSDAPPATPAPSANQPESVTAASVIEEIRAGAAAEHERLAAIRQICGENHQTIAAEAIRDNWSRERTELAVLRAERPQAPAAILGGGSDNDGPAGSLVLEAAICQSARLANLESQFSEQVLEAADQRFHGRLGLQELILHAAHANGFRGMSMSDTRAVLQAAFSTTSLPGIFANVANKFLLDGFLSVERAWREISAIRNVRDFKRVTSYRLNAASEYDKVGPDGELKHGTLGETSFGNQAETYGRMFAITRKDIINDDLGALTDVPLHLGRGAGLKLNTVFWTVFMDNASFFASGNNNYISGAATALTIDGLTEAETAFYDQVDENSNPIAVMAKKLLVPNALDTQGRVLMNSQEIRDTTASKKTPTMNPHTGKYDVVRSSYLGNTSFTGNSTKAWYLLADPRDMPVVEVAFLNGREQPIVESAEADFNTLGVQMRGYHDFGVEKQEYRGGVKSKGEA